jgi:hypothetical protein
MTARRRFWNRWTAMGAALLVVVLAWTAYHRSEDAYCSKCWAESRVDEYGLAWSESARWPLRRVATLSREPSEPLRRFLAADHVHDSSAPGMGWSHWQCLGLAGAIGCGRRIPVGGFAHALECEPEFATFLEARIADGSLDIATVRALIAVPPNRRDDDGRVDERLLAKGRELYAAFSSRTGRGADVWDYMPPSVPTEPVVIDDK